MSNPDTMGKSIADYIRDPKSQITALIRSDHVQTRLILCGPSGTGKSLSVKAANKLLPQDQQIAEVNELLMLKQYKEAESIATDYELRPETGKHVAFNMINKEIAAQLEKEHWIKVFWFAF